MSNSVTTKKQDPVNDDSEFRRVLCQLLAPELLTYITYCSQVGRVRHHHTLRHQGL